MYFSYDCKPIDPAHHLIHRTVIKACDAEAAAWLRHKNLTEISFETATSHEDALAKAISALPLPDSYRIIPDDQAPTDAWDPRALTLIEALIGKTAAPYQDAEGKIHDIIPLELGGHLTLLADIAGTTGDIILISTFMKAITEGCYFVTHMEICDEEKNIDFGSYHLSRETPAKEIASTFWDAINGKLDDPFIDHWTDARDEETEPQPGEPLVDMTRILVTYAALHNNSTPEEVVEICYDTACDDNTGGIGDLAYTQLAQHDIEEIAPVLQKLFLDHKIYGSTLSYNDNAENRQSGYWQMPLQVRIDVDIPASAHDRLEFFEKNQERAVAWMTAHDYDRTDIKNMIGIDAS